MISNPALGGVFDELNNLWSKHDDVWDAIGIIIMLMLGVWVFFLFDLFALKSFILRLISIVSALYLNSKSDFVFRRKKIFPNSRNCKLL